MYNIRTDQGILVAKIDSEWFSFVINKAKTRIKDSKIIITEDCIISIRGLKLLLWENYYIKQGE
jgi:hypothetical protein